MPPLKFGQSGVNGANNSIAAAEITAAAAQTPPETAGKPALESEVEQKLEVEEPIVEELAPAIRPATIFSCHPMQEFSMGRFRFAKTQLRLHDEQDVKEFQDLLAQQPVQIRSQVKQLDVAAADALVRELKKSGFSSSTGIDTTANDLQPRPVQEA